MAVERAEAERKCGRQIGDKDLASYLMYPKVFTDFCAASWKYGPVSVLRTSIVFCGMETGNQLSVEIEPGKTLVVRLQAICEVDDEGKVKVFFELNGQPRVVKVPDRAAVRIRPGRRKAEEGNDTHVAAPLAGSVSSAEVQKGQTVQTGSILLTLQAMKMENCVYDQGTASLDQSSSCPANRSMPRAC